MEPEDDDDREAEDQLEPDVIDGDTEDGRVRKRGVLRRLHRNPEGVKMGYLVSDEEVYYFKKVSSSHNFP